MNIENDLWIYKVSNIYWFDTCAGNLSTIQDYSQHFHHRGHSEMIFKNK